MFQTKICGITTLKDAQLAADAGADALGLNFYKQSPRYISPESASELAEEWPKKVLKVGLFVNEEVDEILDIDHIMQFDMIQLHGDEPPDIIQALSGISIIRAFRCREEGLDPVFAYLNDCRKMGQMPAAVLIDAFVLGLYGGSGNTVDWEAVRAAKEQFAGIPLILAGGLTPENVAQAIETARPEAVDTASGVESSPGVKDSQQMQAFVTQAKAAFAKL